MKKNVEGGPGCHEWQRDRLGPAEQRSSDRLSEKAEGKKVP